MKTRANLVTAVLEDMGVLSVGATPSTDDQSFIEGRIDPFLEDLSVRNVIYISDFQSFPDQIFQHLVDLLVQHCGPAFGRAKNRDEIELIESRLRTIQRIGSGRPDNRLIIDRALTRPRWPYRGRL